MRARTLAALMAVLLFAWPVSAQEQRGSIQGQVKDSSGAVLPGVTVVAKGNALPGGTTSVSDAEGFYRFPGLPPGQYEVTAELTGFAPAKVVREGRSPLGRAGKVQSFEITGERDGQLVRALVHVGSSRWRTYLVTMLTGENPSKRRLTQASRILATVSFSKPRKI